MSRGVSVFGWPLIWPKSEKLGLIRPPSGGDSHSLMGYMRDKPEVELTMADYKHGSMDIKTHERTFASFLSFVKWGVIISLAILVFMALVNA